MESGGVEGIRGGEWRGGGDERWRDEGWRDGKVNGGGFSTAN